MDNYNNRKQFITAQGAECKNWNWSWSFVNHDEKLVIFGAWHNHDKGPKGQTILAEDWALTAKGKAASGYKQSFDHLKLVMEQGYTIKTFPIFPVDENHVELGVGPSRIESFTPVLSIKTVEKIKDEWVALDTPEQSAERFSIGNAMLGDGLYQHLARAALPLLVRQALAEEPISYKNLAAELGMSNPRHLNKVLDAIGQTMLDMSAQLDGFDNIPPIQCLVINKKTGIPGEGVGFALPSIDIESYKKMTLRQQENLVASMLVDIYGYKNWKQVLQYLGLGVHKSDYVGGTFSKKTGSGFNGGGEGPRHKALKEFVAQNPLCISLPKSCEDGEVEYALPSGDSVDVMFNWRGLMVAVEVKSIISGLEDLRRGLYQCVKYKAVTQAYLGVIGHPKNVRSVLVLERDLPNELIPLKNTLGIEVIVVDVSQ